MTEQTDLFESDDIETSSDQTEAAAQLQPPDNLRQVILRYIQQRLQEKLDGLKPEQEGERAKLLLKYTPETWLDDAARRISHIQLATHTAKQHHPSSKASAVYAGTDMPHGKAHQLLGTQNIAPDADVIGSAASLDIFKMLRLEFDGETLLSRLLRHDPEFQAALADDPEIAQIRFARFAAFAQVPEQLNAGRTAKQVYFPVADDTEYHVLTIFYPSSLVHQAWQQIGQDRFGETQKIVRQHRYDQQYHPAESREYPNLLTQSYGGSKPQNISQLNSDRRGSMWLLPSLPPVWQGQAFDLPRGQTVFSGYLARRPAIKALLGKLGTLYLTPDWRNNVDFRDKRNALINALIDEVLVMSFELQQHAPVGWAQAQNLYREEAYWLDVAYRDQLFALEDQDALNDSQAQWLAAYRQRDWHAKIGQSFGSWLNEQLKKSTQKRGLLEDLDDREAKVWSNLLRDTLQLLNDEVA